MILPKKQKKQSKTHNIELNTTLYDINKDLVEKNLITLTTEELQTKKIIIKDFLSQTNNTYYMLLCNDKKDYTLFKRKANAYNHFLDMILEDAELEKTWNVLIDECLPNRGQIKSIDLSNDKQAIEIWISINNESYCYYFFPYDSGVINC